MGSAASELNANDKSWANHPIVRFVLICAVFAMLYNGVHGAVVERFYSDDAGVPLDVCTKIDFQMNACDSTGNVFLLCRRFFNNPVDVSGLNLYYFRANYALWPRYVVTPDPSRPDSTKQLLYNHNLPGEQWLTDHNVKTVLLCDNAPVVPRAFKYNVTAATQADQATLPPPPSATPDAYAWCGAYLVLLLLCGYAVVCLLMGPVRQGAAEIIGASITGGAAVFSLALIFVSMAGHAPNRTIVLCIGAIWLVVMCLLIWKRRLTLPEKPAGSWLQMRPVWLLIPPIALVAGIAAIVDDTLIQPTLLWDAFSIWQLKTKVLFFQALSPQPDYFANVGLNYSHLRYPILVPMLSTGVNAIVGHIDEVVQKGPFLLLYLALAALVYGAILSRRGAGAAIVATSLLLTLPDYLHLGGTGTADLALAAFAASSFVFLLQWIQRQEPGDLLMTLLFSVACVWSKNEGGAVAVANLLVLWLVSPRRFSRRSLALVAGFAIIVALLYLPWMNYIKDMPRTDEDYAGRLNVTNIVQALPNLPHVTVAVLRQMIDLKKWGVFWLLPVILTLLSQRREQWRPLIALWLLMFLNMAAWIVAFMVTPLNFDSLLPAVGGRLLMQLAPAAALLIGLQWPVGCAAAKPAGAI